jgi:hypothetical protein
VSRLSCHDDCSKSSGKCKLLVENGGLAAMRQSVIVERIYCAKVSIISKLFVVCVERGRWNHDGNGLRQYCLTIMLGTIIFSSLRKRMKRLKVSNA